MRQIAIYGAGGHGRELAWLVAECNTLRMEQYEIACFIDDNVDRQGALLDRIPIMGLAEAKVQFPNALVVGGIGAPRVRQILMERAAQHGFGFATLVHPGVRHSGSLQMDPGTVICAGCILTVDIKLGHHTLINIGCTVAHDVVLGDYATLGPGVHIPGNVQLGHRVNVGAGAVFVNGTPEQPLTIGDDAVIGAGACVTRPVPPGVTVVGVPAKPLQK